MRRIVLTILAVAAIFSVNVTAQNSITVRASVDSLAMFIGDQANVTFLVSQPAGAEVQMPLLSDTIASGLEIVDRSRMDTTVLEDGTLKVEQRYRVTAFDPALILVPPYPFVYEGDTFYSDPLTLKVVDVPVDTTQRAIADIKGVYDPPFNWRLFFQIALYVLLALAVAVAAYFIVRKYWHEDVKGSEAATEPVDPRLPHEIAMDELNALREEKLWQNNRVKEYYTRLTDIVRSYLGRRYGMDALESTSEELLAAVRMLKLPKEQADAEKRLKELLSLADLVKFAKYIPMETDHDICFSKAVQIVELTKEKPMDDPQKTSDDHAGEDDGTAKGA